MSADITTSVEVAGTRLPTSSADLHDGKATVLDGLTIRWGRSSRLDQPRPSTASLSIAVPETLVSAVTDLCEPGAPIIVTSETAPGTVEEMIVVSSTAQQVHTIDTVARLMPAAPPPEGYAPAAWDHLPTMTRGAVYHAALTVTWLPPDSTIRVAPVYASGPWPSTWTLGPVVASTSTTGPLHALIDPPDEHLGTWVGLAIWANPLGPMWAALTTLWETIGEPWERYGRAETTRHTLTRAGASSATATPFAGRITDAALSWDETIGMPRLQLIAADASAEHANIRIGDDPWPSETAAERIGRAINAARKTIRTVIDPAPGALTLAPKDIDSQSLTQVLRAVATSTGAILWPAAHRTTGEYYRLEDLNRRRSLYKLRQAADGHAFLETASTGATILNASTLARDVDITRDTTDLATTVTVTWTEPGVDDTGKPTSTQHNEKAKDQALIDRLGHRSVSITTDLQSAADAQALANATLARSAPGGWTIPEARLDTRMPTLSPQTTLLLLDSTTRIGHPLIINGAAPWVPGFGRIPVYLDGGIYTYRNGRWTLGLQLTRAAVPGDALTWKQSPISLTWTLLDALTWLDLATATI